jgi:choloylglycine hydrolase
MDTPDGPVFGTNLDLFIPGDGLVLVNLRGLEKQAPHAGTTGEELTWVTEYGSVTFSLAGNGYAWGGMNEAGMVVTTMQLAAGEYPEPDERPAVFDGGLPQYILDTCSTIEEVLDTNSYMRVHDIAVPSHYFISDAEGNSAVIEYIDGEFVAYHGESLPMKALANGPYERAVAAYNGKARWWWSNPGASNERVAACHERNLAFDAESDTSAVNYAFGTLMQYVVAGHTRWNIVFDIPNREIYYRTDQSPAFKSISMREFEFSCDAPKLMLDVNVQAEGSVEEQFVPYDSAVNLNVFQTFCERYGIDVSDEDARTITEFFDGFECAK